MPVYEVCFNVSLCIHRDIEAANDDEAGKQARLEPIELSEWRSALEDALRAGVEIDLTGGG